MNGESAMIYCSETIATGEHACDWAKKQVPSDCLKPVDATLCYPESGKFLRRWSVTESKHVVYPHCAGVNRVPMSRFGEGGRCGRCKQPLFDGRPAESSGATFQTQLTRSDIPLLVDFWAPWCGPCRMMAPAFEQAARQLEPDVRLLKVNTEEQQAVAAQFGIRGIPTMILFAHGRELDRLSGATDAAGIIGWVRQHLR